MDQETPEPTDVAADETSGDEPTAAPSGENEETGDPVMPAPALVDEDPALNELIAADPADAPDLADAIADDLATDLEAGSGSGPS